MEKMTQDIQDPGPQNEKLISSVSPKRPRTDWVDNCSKKSRFDFSETFQETNGTWQNIGDLLCTSQCDNIEDEKPHEGEDNKLLIPITGLTTSHADDAHAGSLGSSFITPERPLLLLEKDEQPHVTDCDKLNTYLLTSAGVALTDFPTSKYADISSPPDCKSLWESLEDKPPGSCSLPSEIVEDGKHPQNSVNQTKVFNCTSSDEEVTCQCGCTQNELMNNTGICNTQRQSVEVQGNNHTRDENRFSEKLPIEEEKDDCNTHTSYSDYTDMTLFYLKTAKDHSENLAQRVKNEQKKFELQICENEGIAVSETKGQVNENSVNKNAIHSGAECAEGSIVSYDVVSSRNTASENMNLKANVFSGAKGDHAAGKMIAKAQSEMVDHTAETPLLARISEEPTEGDNDVGPFTVIDPAIWNETDREILCNSVCNAGAELSPSVKVCEMEMPLSLFDIRPSQEISVPDQTWQFNHPSRTQQCKDEKEDLCQLHTEPQACSIATNGTHHKTGKEGHCLWKSGPSICPKPPFAEDGREDGLETVGLLKEQDLSGCFPVNLENLETQEVENAATEISLDEVVGLKERQAIRSDEHGKSEKSMDLTEKPHQNETEETERSDETSVEHEIFMMSEDEKKGDTTEVSPDDWISHRDMDMALCPEGNMSDSTNKSTLVSQHELSCFLDCQNKAETFMAEHKDDLLASASPVASDAVVPVLGELTPSESAPKVHAALNHSDRFSPVPSAYIFCDRVPGGFDTFERIQLSLDDDDDSDGSMSNSPLITSLAGQQQICHSTPEAENTNQHDVVAEEEEKGVEVEIFTLSHTKRTLSSDYSCNEVPQFTTITDTDNSVQHDLNLQSSNDGSLALALNDSTEFQMKEQFDMVLKELNLYFDISMSEYICNMKGSSPSQCSNVTIVLEDKTSEQLSSSDLKHHKDTSSDEADEDRSLDMCGGAPVLFCASGSGDSEQEVPLGSSLCQKAFLSTADKNREPQEKDLKRRMWSPSFICQPFVEQLIHRKPEQSKRLEPLKTCTRPIRVGLSKRAKTKRLHLQVNIRHSGDVNQ